MNGKLPIVENISFSMESGQILGLLGPNACGKSSLIRAIAGFIPHMKNIYSRHKLRPLLSWGEEKRMMSGRIFIDEQEIDDTPPGKRGLALVPQNLALYPDKTVLENIAFPLLMKGETPANAKRYAEKMVRRLELECVMERLPSQISGGQQQRVAIGRALIAEPRVLLLDEPLASLDALSKRDILTFIGQVLREKNTSAVYVTHDPEEANLLCDQVAFVHDHYLRQIATPQEVFESPATLFIARMFAGFTNVIPSRIDKSRLLVGNQRDWRMDIEEKSEGLAESKGECFTAVRPQALSIIHSRPGGAPGIIKNMFTLDGQPYAWVQIKNGILLSCPIFNKRRIGDTVRIGFNDKAWKDIRVFSADGNNQILFNQRR
jgi:ABC-type sugar transport system ATPase subunit